MNFETTETERKWLQHYTPLWSKFWDEINGINPKGSAVPHLPHCGNFNSYESSYYKIAFVGIDAYGWGNNLEKYSASGLKNYLKDCQSEMNEGSNWSNPNPIFWNFIFKFLGEIYNMDWREIKNNPESDIVQSVIWGNRKSLWRDEKTNMEFWNEVDKASNQFDNLQHLIDVFQPQIIVMVNYSDKYDYIKYLPNNFTATYKCGLANEEIDYHFWDKTGTSIFVTYHPRAMRFKSINEANLITAAIEKLRTLNLLR